MVVLDLGESHLQDRSTRKTGMHKNRGKGLEALQLTCEELTYSRYGRALLDGCGPGDDVLHGSIKSRRRYAT